QTEGRNDDGEQTGGFGVGPGTGGGTGRGAGGEEGTEAGAKCLAGAAGRMERWRGDDYRGRGRPARRQVRLQAGQGRTDVPGNSAARFRFDVLFHRLGAEAEAAVQR